MLATLLAPALALIVAAEPPLIGTAPTAPADDGAGALAAVAQVGTGAAATVAGVVLVPLTLVGLNAVFAWVGAPVGVVPLLSLPLCALAGAGVSVLVIEVGGLVGGTHAPWGVPALTGAVAGSLAPIAIAAVAFGAFGAAFGVDDLGPIVVAAGTLAAVALIVPTAVPTIWSAATDVPGARVNFWAEAWSVE